MATYRHWSVSLCRDPDDVSRCRILLPDKTEWRLISATLYGWRRCFVADQLWLMKRIREEEECQLCHNNPDLEVKGQGQSWRRHHSEPLQSSSYPSLTFQWTSWFIVFEARVSAANKIIHRMGEWQKLMSDVTRVFIMVCYMEWHAVWCMFTAARKRIWTVQTWVAGRRWCMRATLDMSRLRSNYSKPEFLSTQLTVKDSLHLRLQQVAEMIKQQSYW